MMPKTDHPSVVAPARAWHRFDRKLVFGSWFVVGAALLPFGCGGESVSEAGGSAGNWNVSMDASPRGGTAGRSPIAGAGGTIPGGGAAGRVVASDGSGRVDGRSSDGTDFGGDGDPYVDGTSWSDGSDIINDGGYDPDGESSFDGTSVPADGTSQSDGTSASDGAPGDGFPG